MNVPEMTPAELARALEAGDAVQVLDVRAPQRVAAGHIDIAPEGRFHNIVGSQLVQMLSPEQIGLDQDVAVAVVCGHGNDSKVVAGLLNQIGYRASSLSGGMAGWMLLNLSRELPAPASLDRLIQFDRVGKGALGYLLVSDGEALIIDPPRDLSAFAAALEDADAEIVAVADTHCHADYLSGGPGLSHLTGAPYYLHPADSSYPYDGTPGRLRFEAITEGAKITVGRSTVRVHHTPGHTEGSVTYVADDQAAFTGDFVFIASVGRPDLAGKTEEWTGTLWDSLERARNEWSSDLAIYPAHYASDDERSADHSVGAPFGQLLSTNEALQISEARAFREWVQSRTGSFPDAYRKIKAVNVGLVSVNELEAEALEVGKNECALA
jgi:glyoxylase-like metal-dependent hydrolase (beta-lactamase superfamily II)